MSRLTVGGHPVAKKKAEAKQLGTLLRASDEFAEAVRKGASLEGVSIATWLDAHVRGCVDKRYKETLARESRRLEGKE